MPILISAHGISKSFSVRPLFEGLDLVIESGERIGLIGPNGAGKSSLLRILAGKSKPDDGSLSLQKGLRVGYLEQTPQLDLESSVEAAVLEGTEDSHDWESIERAKAVIARLELNQFGNEVKVGRLSGGWRKRVALARELVREPDLLLLDEPTNHLDVESILWLESLLARSSFATLTITHDRLFLQRIANRIVELDRRNPGGLLSVMGDYAAYLDRKADALAAQEQRETVLKNTLRRETEWLRRGAKARTTKQQARIQRAGDLKSEVEELEYRNQSKSVTLDFQSSDRKPTRLIEAKGISKAYGPKPLFSPLDLLISPGSRVGLLGSNGCGKSTLLRILLGNEAPDAGTVFRSDKLAVAYFEQNREALDPTKTVLKTLCPGGDHVNYRGKLVHIRGYLDRFLFRNEQIEMQVGKLSGGEQSRLLVAQLMLKEANVLVLDEPTNDLDIATLDVLQEVLTEFDGAVLLVTHDRYFLDQVATQILAFPEREAHDRKIISFADLSQWENWREVEQARKKAESSKAAVAASEVSAPKKRKLSYKEQRELEGMEARILEEEEALAKAQEDSQSPEVATSSSKLTEIFERIAKHQSEVERLYARWAELEKARDGV